MRHKPVIHYFPLEHLEQRYTTHLDSAILEYLNQSNIAYRRYYPEMYGREKAAPPKGCFLNAKGTIEFKMRQIAELAQNWDWVKDGDILFFSDLWFPGLESIRYLEHFTHKKNIQIRGLLHAGSFTDTDEVRKLERWAAPLENSWFDQIDQVFVGSNFMKLEVCSRRILPESKVDVTEFPLDAKLKSIKRQPKENIVVFNGRDHDEKQPWLFDKLARNLAHTGARFIWTQKMGYSKQQYYDLLSRAKLVVSFALQENFGFGILEAAYLGCHPVLPKRLVYPEFFNEFVSPHATFYRDYDECEREVADLLDSETNIPKDSPGCFNRFFDIPEKWFNP